MKEENKEIWIIDPATEDNVFKAIGSVREPEGCWWVEKLGWTLWEGRSVFHTEMEAIVAL